MTRIQKLLLGTTLSVGLALAGGSAYAGGATGDGGYVSVFGGYSLPTTATGHYSDETTFTANYNAGYLLGAAVGGSVMPSLRAEGELSYVTHDVNGTLGLNVGGATGSTSDTGSLSSIYLLGNLWYDIDTGSGFTPYIGGGAGVAYVKPTNFTFGSGTEAFNTGSFAPAAQIGAGVKFDIADNMSVDLGYRAKGFFNATFAPDSGPNSATGVSGIDQSVQVGLTIGF